MKKRIIFVLLTLALTAGVFAQSNTVFGTLGLISAELSYERGFNKRVAAVFSASYNNFLFGYETAIAAKLRVYPFNGVFFFEVGGGFGSMIGLAGSTGRLLFAVFTLDRVEEQDQELRVMGALATLGIGWKIDIGKPGGFILPINLGMDYVHDQKSPEFDLLPWLRLGIGYPF